MEEKVNWITSLVDKYLRAEISEEEKAELNGWLDESENNRTWFYEIVDKEILAKRLQKYSSIGSEAIWQKTVDKINSGATVVKMHPGSGSWKRYVIAASVLVIISTAAWLLLNRSPKKELVEKKEIITPVKAAIVQGSKKAVLTLADGSGIALDKVNNGIIAEQGETKIIKTGGEVLYRVENVVTDNKMQYNTITTPKGGDYKIILPDGSTAWLNAASSLRFPIVFAGNDRNVQLTGEAYFEVSKNKAKPFIVSILKNGHLESKVRVTGTHFDIQAYDDEKNIETSLLAGSVQVTAENQNVSSSQEKGNLRPGQQAQVRDGKVKVIEAANLKNVIAWTEGYFVLEGPNANIGSILRQIERWYDVDVEFNNQDRSRKFVGKLPRDAKLETVIEVLRVNNYHVEQEDHKLIVTP